MCVLVARHVRPIALSFIYISLSFIFIDKLPTVGFAWKVIDSCCVRACACARVNMYVLLCRVRGCVCMHVCACVRVRVSIVCAA